MPPRPAMRAVPVAAALLLALSCAGCGQYALTKPQWPWHHSPPPPPTPVHVLDVGGSSAAAVLAQYWKRNTLVVDLTAASGSGSITLRPPAEGWPVRVALRITPGAVGELDVRGAQRMVLPVVPGAGKPVELELAPGIYPPKTPEIAVAWGPAGTAAT